MREALGNGTGPFIAATDYMKTVPDQIRQWVPGRYAVLGTDGFGRSDSRAELRRFFEVDRHYVVSPRSRRSPTTARSTCAR